MGQELKFTKPVHIGDTVTATATVEEIILEKNRAILDTTVVNQDGEIVIKGKANCYEPPMASIFVEKPLRRIT